MLGIRPLLPPRPGAGLLSIATFFAVATLFAIVHTSLRVAAPTRLAFSLTKALRKGTVSGAALEIACDQNEATAPAVFEAFDTAFEGATAIVTGGDQHRADFALHPCTKSGETYLVVRR